MFIQRARLGLAGVQCGGVPWLHTGVRLASEKANPAYRNFQDQIPKQDGPRHVPSEAELGSEKEIKWGVNIPNSAEQLVDEAKYAGRGIAEAVGTAASAVLGKAHDQVESAKRSVGIQTESKPMSDEDMGAAGKMQQPPPSANSGGPEDNVRAKYDELKDTVAPHFPEGERSTTEQWSRAGHQNSPDTASNLAAHPEDRQVANRMIWEEIKGVKKNDVREMDESRDTGSEVSENLHYRGP